MKISRSRKCQPLFQFDRRPYQYKVDQIAAQLAAARQNVNVLKADVDAAAQGAKKTKVELDYAQYQKRIFDKLAQEQAVREEEVEQMADPSECGGSHQRCGIGPTRTRQTAIQIRD